MPDQEMSQPTPPRLSRGELFMMVARLFGMRSTCPRAQVGAIAVVDGRIVATGYVGAPQDLAHCTEVGCELENGHCVRTVHAEANVVGFAARLGQPLEDAVIYSTMEPCYTCAKLLINAGVDGVIYDHEYSDHRGSQLLRDLGVSVEHYDTEPAS